jgi:hypothetical protein
MDALPTSDNDPASILALFEVYNGTGMGLTLTAVESRVDDLEYRAWERDEPQQVLPPKHDYTISAGFLLINTPQLLQRYKTATLRIEVVGTLTFIDAFDEVRTQPFGFAYSGGLHGWKFIDYSGSMAEHALPRVDPDQQKHQSQERQ